MLGTLTIPLNLDEHAMHSFLKGLCCAQMWCQLEYWIVRVNFSFFMHETHTVQMVGDFHSQKNLAISYGAFFYYGLARYLGGCGKWFEKSFN